MRLTPKRRHQWLTALVLVVLLAGCDTVSMPVPPSGGTANPAPSTGAQAPGQPSPTIAPPAPALLARAMRARENGDYLAAATDLRALLDAHPDAQEARPAGFYLAESFALRRDWSSAVEALRGFVDGGPRPVPPDGTDDFYARALFLLARGHEQAGAWADAVEAYERYRALKTPLEPYARLRQAAQQQALGRNAEAAASYEAVAAGDIARGERAGAYEKAIALRRQLGQNDSALQLYRKLLDLADMPSYRARILSEAAALAVQSGASDQARTWWREIVERAPGSPQALDVIAQLAGDQQSELTGTAARIYGAHERWAEALLYYDTAIAAVAGEDALELRRQRALARRGTGDFAGALDELAAVGAASPDGQAGRQAQLDWVQTKGQSGDIAGAIGAYREYAQAYPDDPRAPEALGRAATLLGRQGDAVGALDAQLELGRRYPTTDQGHDALFLAGWSLFRAGRMEEARGAWDLLRQNVSGVTAAQAAFWAARTVEQTSPDYTALLDAAIAAAPDSYFGARAAELLDKHPAGGAPIGAPIDGESWRAAEDWIASWSGAPAYHLDERGYPPELAQAGAVLRAMALQDVGLQPEAIAEWNEAREAWREDPVKLYLLARRANDHGAPYIALKAAEDLTRRSPEKGFAKAPEALRRLIFPTPFADMILEQAAEHDLDPLALYGMLRQESLFNSGARSGAGALGLAQVMPTTAQGIAQNLGVPDFQEDDLFRPAVSVRFGAFYLSHQLETMQGSLPAALAAYNGGPGNAQRWAGGTSVADQDLFVESIDYEETRAYVKLVYGYYGAYRRLYVVP